MAGFEVSTEELGQMLRHLPEDLRPPVQFAYITGWRLKSEVLSREWRHVDFADGKVSLFRGEAKNREPRDFYFTRELRELLEAQRAKRDALKQIISSVFFRMVALGRGGPLRARPILSLGKAFTAACKAAGVPGKLPHDMRRSAVRNLVRAGISQTVAMKMVGHKTDSMFRRYNITSDEDLRSASAQLDEVNALGNARRSGTQN
jgi:integrase